MIKKHEGLFYRKNCKITMGKIFQQKFADNLKHWQLHVTKVENPYYLLTFKYIGPTVESSRIKKFQIQKKMKSKIQLKLFATLHEFEPPSSDNYSIEEGISIRELLQQLELPPEKAKLVFINGIKADLTATLKGGERVGIFPPVGGG